jgi:N-methylhydantoinase A
MIKPEDQVSIGVDTGGTHTDLVLAGRNRLVTLKVPSTREDLTVGIMAGIERIVELAGVPRHAVARLVYGSTFVTNLIVEETETRVGLITTAGFRDVLQIGRASRKPDVYDIHWRPAPALVPRHLRFGVPERMNYAGEVVTPLDEGAARDVLRQLRQAGVQSIAVCLLHAYANPEHERRIAALAQEVCPDIPLSLSSSVVREFREYERTSTTCVSSFIKQPTQKHLAELKQALADHDVPAMPYIMRGNGGVSTFDLAAQVPIAITHSGVMGGIVGASALAQACRIDKAITLDMGGTSADVSLILGGNPVMTNRSHIGPHPLLAPTLDMVTIGAGGGSIAWLDGGTALRVGPRSAGSSPGPVCYGQGGTEPTVTDANLVAGRLNDSYFLGGARLLQRELARQAIEARIAKPLGLTLQEAAMGIISIAEAHMVNAIRLMTVDRGLDPRDFTLVAFGGAGPLHAVSLAEALSIRSVLIPPAPGNMSAMGLLCADVRHDHVQTIVTKITPDIGARLIAVFDGLMDEARAGLAADGVDAASQRYEMSADLRYEGQNYELTLPLARDTLAQDLDALIERFNVEHQRVYGYNLRNRAVQIVNARVSAVGVVQHASWPTQEEAAGPARPIERRSVLVRADTRVDTPIYRYDDLRAGQSFTGPALLEYAGGTLFVPPDWDVALDGMMNARLARKLRPAPAAQSGVTQIKEQLA